MTSLALTGIGRLVTCDPEHGRGAIGVIEHAALVIDEGRVVYAGTSSAAPAGTDAGVDVGGRCVMPGFVDSHTHLIFAGDRAEEFALRMAGRPYRPGGILDTVAATRAASPEELEANARRLIDQARASGTTTVEIKTGYGLTPDDEAMHLGIAQALSPEATFLGAHLVPAEFAANRDGYLQLLVETMIPAAAATARWCDAFCEVGAFDVAESRAVLTAAAVRGMGLRVHANQLRPVRWGRAGLRARRRLGRPLHPPHQRGHRRPGEQRHRRHPAPDQRLLHARSHTPTAGPSWTRAPPWRWPATATPAPATRPP